MKLSSKIDLIKKMLRAVVFKKRTPLFVSWEITRQCNLRCKYCNLWDNPPEELDTRQVLSIIRELSLLGTRIIHFTGGEALLRSDFGQILNYCHQRGISTSLNSNGALVPARINELKTLLLLGISLDGPKQTHDSVRGVCSYKKAMEALVIARDRGIGLRLLTVLSKQNLDAVDFLLEKAREFNAPVIFQPATEHLLGGREYNPLAPDVERYRRIIKELIVKKRGSLARYIANSLSGLKFLYDWPNPKRIKCLVNLISCRIESNGYIYICFRNQYQKSQVNRGNMTIALPFLNLPLIYCEHCCCASLVEINCLMRLKLDTIINSFRFI